MAGIIDTSLQTAKNTYGLCPFRGGVVLVENQTQLGKIVQPATVDANCVGDKCQLWNKEAGMCAIKAFCVGWSRTVQ